MQILGGGGYPPFPPVQHPAYIDTEACIGSTCIFTCLSYRPSLKYVKL